LRLERDLHRLVAAPLAAMGHQVELAAGDWVGGYQAIKVVPDARTLPAEGAVAPAVTFRGGSDHRKDGQVVGY
jgi:gamma-glutamyltranspeptidase